MRTIQRATDCVKLTGKVSNTVVLNLARSYKWGMKIFRLK